MSEVKLTIDQKIKIARIANDTVCAAIASKHHPDTILSPKEGIIRSYEELLTHTYRMLIETITDSEPGNS